MHGKFIDTSSYCRNSCLSSSIDTQTEFKNFIGVNFLQGDIIPDTGGLRKIRWKGSGKGKRGGTRVIYYFCDENHPIYLLFAYSKNAQTDLTEHEKKLLRRLVLQLKNSFRFKENNSNG